MIACYSYTRLHNLAIATPYSHLLYKCIANYVYVCACMHVSTCAHVCVCCPCMCVCLYTCVYVCICVCVCVKCLRLVVLFYSILNYYVDVSLPDHITTSESTTEAQVEMMEKLYYHL